MANVFLACAVLATASSGCGRISFDVLADSAPDVFPRGPFGTPTRIDVVAAPGRDDDPALTADGLELYFCSDRVGSVGLSDIYRSTRTSTSLAWTTPTPVSELDTVADEDSIGISPDGLTMWITTDQGGDYDIWVTTRPDRTTPWSAPSRLAELSSVGDRDDAAQVSRDLLRMAMHRGSTGNLVLWESSRATPTSVWSTPVELTELNVATEDSSGMFVSDLELWFDSTRAGGLGGADIYSASRSAVGNPFDSVTPAAGLNSSGADVDVWLSPDGHWAVFASDRGGDFDLWEATR